MIRRAALALVCALALPAGLRADPAPADSSCSNPRLPPGILDGPIAPPARPLPVVRAGAPAGTLRLAVAADSPTRELGLMCVTRLRPRSGMIFVFPETNGWGFWMKNTLVPLDMIWVDEHGLVTTVAADVPASTRETADAAVARRSGFGRYTIELAAGEAARDGIVPGSHLRLPKLKAAQ